MTVLVSVPYYRNPEWVGDAVRSVLAQTHRDLVCVVVGDGEEPPLTGINDSRLVVYTMPENRGAYFALQLMLQASPHEWHAPHGSDDWTDPAHLERLLALEQDAVAMGVCWVHEGEQAMVQSIGREGWHVGIFSTERLRSIGGYDPSARVSQDTHVLKLLDMTGGYHRSSDPTYHIRRRPGSLTTSHATGLTSSTRHRARAKDQRIRSHCRSMQPEAIRAYRASLVPLPIQDALAHHVDRLRALL